jgi:hypothetical protein
MLFFLLNDIDIYKDKFRARIAELLDKQRKGIEPLTQDETGFLSIKSLPIYGTKKF